MTEQAALLTDQPLTSASLVVRVVQQSDVGLVRSENQDFAIQTSVEEDTPAKGRLMVVADGMGGHRGGATASKLAGNTIKTEYLGSSETDVSEALRQAFEQANANIYNEAQQNPDLRGMGTTCSALAVKDGVAHVAHVGDSRIYLIREGAIRQLTDDHSLVASMVREGLLTPKEAEVHPRRNVLQRSMGVADTVEIDLVTPFPVQLGDTFLLCSDGLHGLVREPEMAEVAQLPIADAVPELVRRAIERGAPDNVTVIVARVEQGPPRAVPPPPAPSESATSPDVGEETVPVAALAVAPRRSGVLLWVILLLLVAAVIGLAVRFLRSAGEPSRRNYRSSSTHSSDSRQLLAATGYRSQEWSPLPGQRGFHKA